jgi:hypothetical protein
VRPGLKQPGLVQVEPGLNPLQVAEPSEGRTQGADAGVPAAVVKYRQDDPGRLRCLGEFPAGCSGGRERLVRHDVHAGRDGFQDEFAARLRVAS